MKNMIEKIEVESGYFDFNEGQAPAKGMTKDQYVRMVLNTTQEGEQSPQQVGYEWLTCFMDNIRSGLTWNRKRNVCGVKV